MDGLIQFSTLLVIIAISFFAGVFAIYGVMVYKIWTNDDANDDSNIGNPVDALNHFVLHPTDYQHVYYLTPLQLASIKREFPNWLLKRPLWYMDKDKYSQILKVRP